MNNGLASLFWATEGGVIRNIMDNRIETGYLQMFSFFVVWYFFNITTYGTNIPAGLFLPGMIIGCALGNLYSKTIDDLHVFDYTSDLKSKMHDDIRKKYIIIGCGAFMAGYTRMTYSLGVIIMETSQDLSIFVPIIFAIIISNQVGFKFTRSLYQRATRAKQMPIISDKIPPPCKNLKAGDIMEPNVISLFSVDSMNNVKNSISNNNHHTFPIVSSDNMLVGSIPRNFVLILLGWEAWYSTE